MRRPDLSSTAQYIGWYARNAGEQTAVLEDGHHTTYKILAADIGRCIHILRRRTIQAGTLVGIETPNRYLHLVLLLACEVIGAATISLQEADLSTADSLFPHCDFILSSSIDGPVTEPPRIVRIPPGWPAGLKGRKASLRHRDDDAGSDRMARIVRTSDPLGRPKAMTMSCAVQQRRIVRTMARVARDVLPDPRFLCLYRLDVSAICTAVLATLQHGGTVVFATQPQAASLIASGVVNYALFAPADIERMIQDAVPPPAGHRLTVDIFGTLLSARVRQLAQQRLRATVANLYSTNETTPIAVVGDDNVGILCPGIEVRIVDPAGRDLPLRVPGAIRVRTDTMVQGYFNDPGLTRASFFDGWYQTGDTGFIPAPGKLVVVGRPDNMLNIGGVRIARLPLEERVKQIGGVSDAVAMSVTSPNNAGMLLVAVEVQADTLPTNLLRQIRVVVSRDTKTFDVMPLRWFPRTATGDVQRAEIEAAFRRRHLQAAMLR